MPYVEEGRLRGYFFVIRHVSVCVTAIFLDNEMSMFWYLLAIFPSYQAPAKFGDHRMIAVPSLKINGAPCTSLFGPKLANSLE